MCYSLDMGEGGVGKIETGESSDIETRIEGLKKTLNPLESKQRLSYGEIVDCLRELDNDQKENCWNRVLERITRETGFFKDLESLGIMPLLREGKQARGLPFRVVDNPGIPAAQGGAHYESASLRPLVVLWGPYDLDATALLQSLAGYGEIPMRLENIRHETVHRWQDEPNVVLDIVNKLFMKGWVHSDHGEIQAYTISTFPFWKGFGVEDIVKGARASLAVARDEPNPNKTAFLDEAVGVALATDRAIALGATEKEVARMLYKGSLREIQRYNRKRQEKLSLSDEGVEKVMLAHRLEKQVDRFRAWDIALEEVLRYTRTHVSLEGGEKVTEKVQVEKEATLVRPGKVEFRLLPNGELGAVDRVKLGVLRAFGLIDVMEMKKRHDDSDYAPRLRVEGVGAEGKYTVYLKPIENWLDEMVHGEPVPPGGWAKEV